MTSRSKERAFSSDSPSGRPHDRQAIEVEQVADLRQQGRQAPGGEEGLHQVFARGAYVRQKRRRLGQLVESIERQVDVSTAGDRIK